MFSCPLLKASNLGSPLKILAQGICCIEKNHKNIANIVNILGNLEIID